MALILSRDDVRSLIDMPAVIEAVSLAHADHADRYPAEGRDGAELGRRRPQAAVDLPDQSRRGIAGAERGGGAGRSHHRTL